ncbi:MAG: glutamine-hydrolyzing GMP synthase [Nitrospirae bacterium]|nr:glutamine-hydrolyzing GMP synthase [Nitrospirota bacterium]
MDRIVILDAGGQYTHLIARNVRELGVYSEIVEFAAAGERSKGAKGIIISGGPRSVLEADSPRLDRSFFEKLRWPALGICYGHQLLAYALGGEIKPGLIREYGHAALNIRKPGSLLRGLGRREPVWVSHGDTVVRPPEGFQILASTADCEIAAMGDPHRKFYGVQFHPEVIHTPRGKQVLRNFVRHVCGCQPTWSAKRQVGKFVREIREKAKGRPVLFLVSGGVDSTVAFVLCVKALGRKRVQGIYVDTGLMRKDETNLFKDRMARLGYDNIDVLDRSDSFLGPLRHVSEPERKRKIIGEAFVAVYHELFKSWSGKGDSWMLGQGTIYPDTIESGGTAHAALIKTHHNRVPEIQELQKQDRLIEPIHQLYKDEVRQLGRRLGLPKTILGRLPFPGPGLAIRCLATSKDQAVSALTLPKEIRGQLGVSAYRLPVRSVGVQGDSRTYAHTAVLTGRLSFAQLGELSSAITNKIREINRVAWLVASRPDADVLQARIVRSELTHARLDLLREADATVNEAIENLIARCEIWQCPVVLLPLRWREGETVVIRPVSSRDGMTANFSHLPSAPLRRLARRLLNIRGIDAVLYDVTNKPPGTIEWE